MDRKFSIRCVVAFVMLLCSVMVSYADSREVSVLCEWGALSATLDAPDGGSDTAVVIIAGSGPTDRYGNSNVGLSTYCYKMLADGLVEDRKSVV